MTQATSTAATARWRLATSADREAIVEMCLALYEEDPGLTSIEAAQVRRTLDAFEREPLRGQAVVLEAGLEGERAAGRIVEGGVAVASPSLIGYALLVPFYSNELGGVSCEVDELYVRGEERNRGLGTSLFERIDEGAFGTFVSISLVVTLDNQRARRLYERLGFRALGVTMARRAARTAP